MTTSARTPLSTDSDWTFALIQRYETEIAKVAADFHLDTYPNQIEVISSEQMLDAYASVGLPIGYPHWSYGKEFIINEQAYRRGMQGLAYEIVINSDPCISYLMEENTMMMQALVLAHAAYGHNSFFKGNYLFRMWTSADAILDYLVFARRFVMDCEERYGIGEVEAILDSCHALMHYGVDRYKRPSPLSLREEKARLASRDEHERLIYNDIWRTLPKAAENKEARVKSVFPSEPQENILYFIEKYSPKLEPWQRELVRIVRKLAQYFYPQAQTKVMNEGWATFWHYTLINELYDKGLVTDGFMFEFLQSHTNVIAQRGFDQPGFGGLNPYALGFAMYSDIKRICTSPTAEDRRWFPQIAGSDWRKTLDFAMRNYKDESFITQFMSPKLIRDFRLFAIADYEGDAALRIDAIHDDAGYRRVRQLLAAQHSREQMVPDIQVLRYERDGDRSLVLRHLISRNRKLDQRNAKEVLRHFVQLWGFTVRLESTRPDGVIEDSFDCQPAQVS